MVHGCYRGWQTSGVDGGLNSLAAYAILVAIQTIDVRPHNVDRPPDLSGPVSLPTRAINITGDRHAVSCVVRIAIVFARLRKERQGCTGYSQACQKGDWLQHSRLPIRSAPKTTQLKVGVSDDGLFWPSECTNDALFQVWRPASRSHARLASASEGSVEVARPASPRSVSEERQASA